MGSASSKAARAFPSIKPGKSSSWGGARTPAHGPKASPPPTARQPWASESKDEGRRCMHASEGSSLRSTFITTVIQRDARDPQLLANLNRLGPVRVDHHMQTVRTVSQTVVRFTTRCVSRKTLNVFVSHK